jgi:hypothetical protein
LFHILDSATGGHNHCTAQLHKPKLLMKQYIKYKCREVSDIIILI